MEVIAHTHQTTQHCHRGSAAEPERSRDKHDSEQMIAVASKNLRVALDEVSSAVQHNGHDPVVAELAADQPRATAKRVAPDLESPQPLPYARCSGSSVTDLYPIGLPLKPELVSVVLVLFRKIAQALTALHDGGASLIRDAVDLA